MSLILDALNKADRERQDKESPPGLHSNHNFFAGHEKMAGWKKIVVIVVVALVLVAAAIAYHLGRQSGSSSPALAAESAGQIKPQQVAEQVQPPAQQIPPVAEKVVQASNTAVAAAGQTAETRALLQKRRIEEQYEKVQAAKAANPAAATTGESVKTPDNIASLYQPAESPPAEQTAPADQTPSAENTAQEQAPANNEPVTETVNNLPVIGTVRDLPWSAQEKVPTLMYTEHRYNNSPNDYVTINGERKTKGQKIANILTVDSILEDGVILRYENHQFKMPALNSWVNM